jgi:uncharacterized SAM-binding protein YcdF (DUF218 family)
MCGLRPSGGRFGPPGRRTALGAAVFALLVAAAVWGRGFLLTGAAQALAVEDPLRPAAAIVVLQGQAVFRDLEAADLYRAGWAPVIVVSRDVPAPQIPAARALGIAYPTNYEVSRAALRQAGVPDEAVVVPDGEALTTADELARVYALLGPGEAPVVLVTSPVHTRRAGLVWRRVAGARRPAVLRGSRYDPFVADGWWRRRDDALALAREYVSLAFELRHAPGR